MSQNAPQTTVDELPPQGLRTFLSFVIFLHLFALFVAFGASNDRTSGLLRQLRQVPLVSAYLRTLNMDLSYGFHLTRASEFDIDYQLEVELDRADGESETVILPESGMWPGQRRRRYQRLAGVVAEFVGDDLVESLLPRAVGAWALGHYEAQQAMVRCRGHLLQDPDSLNSSDPSIADHTDPRWYRMPYEARVFVSGGAVQLLKAESAADSAPAAAADPAPADAVD